MSGYSPCFIAIVKRFSGSLYEFLCVETVNRVLWLKLIVQFSSVQFNGSVVSDSLQPHELQHARPPCPSPTPRVTQTHVHQVGDAIQPSHPLGLLLIGFCHWASPPQKTASGQEQRKGEKTLPKDLLIVAASSGVSQAFTLC